MSSETHNDAAGEAAQKQFALLERVLVSHGWQVRKTSTSTFYCWRRDRTRHCVDLLDLAHLAAEVKRSGSKS